MWDFWWEAAEQAASSRVAVQPAMTVLWLLKQCLYIWSASPGPACWPWSHPEENQLRCPSPPNNASGFSGNSVFTYTISDGVSLFTATATGTLVVPGTQPVGLVTQVLNTFLLLTPADGSNANAVCPDPTPGLAEITAVAVARLSTVPNITGVQSSFVKCDLVVSISCELQGCTRLGLVAVSQENPEDGGVVAE
jgi:hypothetical protein